jgi:hypothetical protein
MTMIEEAAVDGSNVIPVETGKRHEFLGRQMGFVEKTKLETGPLNYLL